MSKFNYAKDMLERIDDIQRLVENGNIINFRIFEGEDNDCFAEFQCVHIFEDIIYDADNMTYSSIRDMIDAQVSDNINWLDKDDSGNVDIYIEFLIIVSLHELNMKRLINIHKLTKSTLTNCVPVPYDMCAYNIYDLIDAIEGLPEGANTIITYNLNGLLRTPNGFIGITNLNNLLDMFGEVNKERVQLFRIHYNLLHLFTKNPFVLTDYMSALSDACNLNISQVQNAIELSSLVLHVFGDGIWIIKCRNKNIGKFINFKFFNEED